MLQENIGYTKQQMEQAFNAQENDCVEGCRPEIPMTFNKFINSLPTPPKLPTVEECIYHAISLVKQEDTEITKRILSDQEMRLLNKVIQFAQTPTRHMPVK